MKLQNVTFFHKFVTMQSTHTHIEHVILRKKGGELIFPTDFRGKGTEDAIKKALSRLTQKGMLKRLYGM